ncbi:hypothetical protein LY76DRAFT_57379 [Colletotrichum caudatum]|nr:hypothetical protein LY76DRAFT_57379 [Colletotrichum caudatum]
MDSRVDRWRRGRGGRLRRARERPSFRLSTQASRRTAASLASFFRIPVFTVTFPLLPCLERWRDREEAREQGAYVWMATFMPPLSCQTLGRVELRSRIVRTEHSCMIACASAPPPQWCFWFLGLKWERRTAKISPSVGALSKTLTCPLSLSPSETLGKPGSNSKLELSLGRGPEPREPLKTAMDGWMDVSMGRPIIRQLNKPACYLIALRLKLVSSARGILFFFFFSLFVFYSSFLWRGESDSCSLDRKSIILGD